MTTRQKARAGHESNADIDHFLLDTAIKAKKLEKSFQIKLDSEINDICTSLEFTQDQIENISKETSAVAKESQPADQEKDQKIAAISQQLHQVDKKLNYLEN